MGSFEDVLSMHTEEIIDLGRDLKLRIGDSPILARDFSPRISYDLLSYKKNNEICFTSEKFTKDDYHIYFKKMIELSNAKMGDLIDGDTNLDFVVYSGANKHLKEIFFEQIGATAFVESIPSFGRLGLYNSDSGKDKAPRIFFAIGHYSTLHILACDPEHKIYGAN